MVAMVVVFIGVRFAWPKISGWRQQKDLNAAAEYERSGDYRRALLALEQVVQLYPDNIEARRRLAGIYERTGQRQAIELWKEIIRLEPNEPENQLGYAGASLRFGDLAEVRRTLRQLQGSGQTGAGYYRLAAGLAMLSHDSAATEHNLAELERREPRDLRVRLQLAAVRLQIPDHPEAQAAREALIGLARMDVMRIRALVELFDDIARRWPKPAVERTAAFQRLVTLLTPAKGPRLDPPEIGDPVEQLFSFAMLQPSPAPEDVGALMNLMIRNGRAAAAFEWLETLPSRIRQAPAILAIKADAALRAGDWPGLGALLREGAWGAVPPEVVDLAFKAHDARRRGTIATDRADWNRVVEAARFSLPGRKVLLRLCDAWNWPEERRQVLEAVTRDFPAENWAWPQLVSFAFSRGDSAEVGRLYQKWGRTQPRDTALQIQVAIMSLLLNLPAAPASAVTQEWMHGQPGNAAATVAHGLALWREHKGGEALRCVEALPRAVFAEPRFALVYGVLLAEAGRAGESEAMLNRAAADRLLPDELVLVEQAHARNQARLMAPKIQ